MGCFNSSKTDYIWVTDRGRRKPLMSWMSWIKMTNLSYKVIKRYYLLRLGNNHKQFGTTNL